jgi:hypothetical protein
MVSLGGNGYVTLMELVIILAIILVVLLAGAFLARNVFVRGTMPRRPEEDRPGLSAVATRGAHQHRRRAQP